MGDEALGVVSSRCYAATIDNPSNKRFVARINRDSSRTGLYSIGAYGAALMLEEAVKAVKGKVEDKAAFMARCATSAFFRSARNVSLDALGNRCGRLHPQGRAANGKLVNAIVKTIPRSRSSGPTTAGVLANPVYSREPTRRPRTSRSSGPARAMSFWMIQSLNSLALGACCSRSPPASR